MAATITSPSPLEIDWSNLEVTRANAVFVSWEEGKEEEEEEGRRRRRRGARRRGWRRKGW